MWAPLALFGVPLVLGVAVRARVGRPVRMATDGMAPTLREGDLVWMSHRHGSEVAAGTIVALKMPGDDGLRVKRVVAVGGQTVEVIDGALWVDGQSVTRTAEGEFSEPWCGRAWTVTPAGGRSLERVPLGSVYVLGDNRRASSDSRQHGPVPIGAVVGIVDAQIWGADSVLHSLGCERSR